MPNGTELYRRYADGDDKALEELVNLYRNGLILFINRFLHNPSVSEEIAADTFVELILHKKRFLGNSDFRTYLYAIARHKTVDYIRKDARKKSVSTDEIADLPDEKDIETELIAEAEKRRLHRAIAALPQDYQAAIYLVYFEDLSYADAARILGKSVKQVDNAVFRAKAALKKILTKGERSE
ncbi:MAG: RNA polymerase sigma factor [Clostridia bacterium]|nr:RNA polymerase sigma factor [Clostridia bacterium]